MHNGSYSDLGRSVFFIYNVQRLGTSQHIYVYVPNYFKIQLLATEEKLFCHSVSHLFCLAFKNNLKCLDFPPGGFSLVRSDFFSWYLPSKRSREEAVAS